MMADKDTLPLRHHCPASRCGKSMSINILMCRDHWRMVPPDLKGAVYATWGERVKRPGDADAIGAHRTAANLAIDSVNAKLAARSTP